MDRRAFVTCSASFALTLPALSRRALALSPRWKQPARSAALAAGRSYDYELCFVPSYGQSLSMGAGAIPSLSLHQRFDSLMFSGGTIPQGFSSNLAQDYATLVPLVENNNQPGFNTSLIDYPGESPLSGAFEATKELMASQDGLTVNNFLYVLSGSCPGQGGTAIAGLQQGTPPYTRLLQDVTAAKAIASAAGVTCGVPCVFWLQGESDSLLTQAEYLASLQQLLQSLNADIRDITGQQKQVQFLLYQTALASCFTVASAQYQLSTQMANVHIASPAYPFQTQGDQIHLLPLSSKLLGAYFGSAYKRVVINHDPWLPLSPQSINANGDMIVIELNMQGTQVVADMFSTTTGSPIKPALGFSLISNDDVILDIDNKVAITGPAQITITAPQTVQPGFTLEYGSSTNAVTGGGGNIRDNYGDQYVFNGGGLLQPLHNWLAVFNCTFAAGATTTVLGVSPNIAAAGTALTVTVTVKPSLGVVPPTGSVNIYSTTAEAQQLLATIPLLNGRGTARLAAAGATGTTYSFTAKYSGDANHTASVSISVPVTIE